MRLAMANLRPLRSAPALESFGSEGDPAETRGAAVPGIAPAEHARALARATAEAHARGYEEGAAAALAQAESDLATLLADLRETLSDQAVTGIAARAAAEKALEPVLAACMTAVAPSLVRRGFSETVLEHLQDILSRAPASRVRLHLHPDVIAPLRQLFGTHGIDEACVDLTADPGSDAFSARIGWADGFDEVSPSTAAMELTARLAPLMRRSTDAEPAVQTAVQTADQSTVQTAEPDQPVFESPNAAVG